MSLTLLRSITFLLCLGLYGCQSGETTSEKVNPTGTSRESGETEQNPPDMSTNEPSEMQSGCADCPPLPTFTPSLQITPNTIYVSAFGATGSGANEEFEIQRAINAAGDGGRVVFDSGREYTICKMLRPRANQLWQPSTDAPATLKRCTSPVTTLTADVTAGATSVSVASSAGFEPGMWISPVRADGDDFYAGDITNHPIYGVSGNVLQFHNGLDKGYQAGDKVVTSFAMITDANGSVFEGLIFDGNAAGNDHFVSWARHSSLWMQSQNSVVRNSTFTNAQGDAITLQGLDNIVEHNTFTNLNGSALHFSAARQSVVRSNHMISTNLKADRVVHAEAALTWSLGNKDLLVEDNCIRDIPAAAFGHILVHGDNYGADIRDNQICNVDSLLLVATSMDETIDLLFTDNSVSKAGRIDLLGNDSTLSGIEVSNNRFEDTALLAKNVEDLSVTDNTFTLTPEADLLDGSEAPGNKVGAITIRGGMGADILDNNVTGGRKGIQVSNASDRATDIRVQGNSLTEQFENGIVIGHLTSIDSADADASDFSGVTVAGNNIISTSLPVSQAAVELGRSADFVSNCVESSGVGVRVHGYPTSPAGGAWQLNGNTISSAGTSLMAHSPYTRGVAISNNNTSNGITPNLLADNPGAEAPGTLVEGC